jgi:hypothetical protein
MGATCKGVDKVPLDQKAAKKALVALQETRTEVLRTAAVLYVDGKLSKESVAKIEEWDARFRFAWAKAAAAVDLWGAVGQAEYQTASDDARAAVIEMRAIAGGGR